MKRILSWTLASLLAIGLLASCDLSNTNPGGGSTNPDPSPSASAPATTLKFNLTGSKAVGYSSSSSSSSWMSRSTAQDADGLVKILDDGSIASIIEVPDGTYLPRVKFIARSPLATKDLYVAFDSDINVSGTSYGSFLHITSDGSYYSALKAENGSSATISNWTRYGEEDAKPVVFDASGNVYFITSGYNGGGWVYQLRKYDPVSHTTSSLTAALEGVTLSNLNITPDGKYLFVQGDKYSTTSGSSSYFRMYSTADMSKSKNIYYSSGTTYVWVRSYAISSDSKYLILNGYNIRGMSGIIKAEIVSIDQINYTQMYGSQSNYYSSWFNVESNSYTDWEGKTQYYGFMDKWDPYYGYVTFTDGTKYYYAPAYYTTYSSGTYPLNYYSLYSSTYSSVSTTPSGLAFAASATDPSQKYTETTFAALKAAGKKPIFKKMGYTSSSGSSTVYNFDKVMPDNIVDSWIAGGQVSSDYYYTWNDHLFPSGVADTATLDAYFGQYFIDDNEFAFGGKTGAAAYTATATKVWTYAELYGDGTDGEFFLSYFKKPGTSTAATTFTKFKAAAGVTYLDFQNVKNMMFDASGNLWGVLSQSYGSSGNKPIPLRLLDSNGKRSLALVNAFKDDTYFPVGFAIKDQYMYFRDAQRDADGQETGFHKLFRFAISATTPTVESMLANVTGNPALEIVDFSVGGGYLYFTGVKQDGTVVCGKVDTTTLAYSPIDSTKRLTNIEVY